MRVGHKTVYFWLRLLSEYDVKYVANELQVSETYIRAIESCAKRPSKRLIRTYARLFNIDESIIYQYETQPEGVSTAQYLLHLLMKLNIR